MANPKKNKGKGNLIYCITMGMVICILAGGLYLQAQDKLRLQQEAQEITMQIEEQKKLNNELKKQTEYRDSDQYIEKIAREQLNMVKPNEIVFIDQNK